MHAPSRRRRAITQNGIATILVLTVMFTAAIWTSVGSIEDRLAMSAATSAVTTYAHEAFTISQESGTHIMPSVADYVTDLGHLPKGTKWNMSIASSAVPTPSSGYGNISVDVADFYTLNPWADGIAMTTSTGHCVMALASRKGVQVWSYDKVIGSFCNGFVAIAGPHQRAPIVPISVPAPPAAPSTSPVKPYNTGNDAHAAQTSCSSIYNCAVVGSYRDVKGTYHGYVIEEISNHWGTVQNIVSGFGPTTSTYLDGVSCPSDGNCVATGMATDPTTGQSQSFVVVEQSYLWQAPQMVASNLAPNTHLAAISCYSLGNCGLAGWYTDAAGTIQSFVDNEIAGTWYPAHEVAPASQSAGLSQLVSISCSSNSVCAAAGHYLNQAGATDAFITQGSGTSWTAPQAIATNLNLGRLAHATSVSCLSDGNCAVVGFYHDAKFRQQAFVANNVNGVWDPAIAIAADVNTRGFGFLSSVSCLTIGNCSAGGSYRDASGSQAFVIDERNGQWLSPVPVAQPLNARGNAATLAISCVTVGNCSAGGFYQDGNGTQAFVADETNGIWQDASPVAAQWNINYTASLTAINCPAQNYCVAAGSYTDAGGAQVFIDSSFAGAWGQ